MSVNTKEFRGLGAMLFYAFFKKAGYMVFAYSASKKSRNKKYITYMATMLSF